MKNSEPIFKTYLTENRFNGKYELPIGGSNPDFSVWEDDSTPFAFWDVADREFTAADQEETERLITRMEQGLPMETVAGPTKGYNFVRSKIWNKFEQFKKAAPIPGMLVLAEWTGRASIDPKMMAAALYGWPQIRLQLNQPNQSVSFGRGEDGKMTDEKIAEDNKHISAIGILHYRPINYFVHGLEQFSKMVLERFDNDLEHALGLIKGEKQRQRSMGIDLDHLSLVLDIFLIHGAHNPWPEELRGKHDRVYSYNEATHHYDLIYDGLRPEGELQVPASGAQQMIWEIAAQPGLRNG